MTLRVRALSEEEAHRLARMTRSQKLGAGLVRRAQIVQHAVDGLSAPGIAARMDLCGATVRFWLKRFNERGLSWAGGGQALGRPPTYSAEERRAVIAAALSRADRVGPAVRVVDAGPLGGLLGREGHRHEAQPGERGAARRRAEVAPGRDLVRGTGGPRVRAQKGAIERLYTAPPEGGVVVCLDEMGPQSAPRATPAGAWSSRPLPKRSGPSRRSTTADGAKAMSLVPSGRPRGRPSPKPTRAAPLRTGSISSARSSAGSMPGSSGSTRWWTTSTSTAPPMCSCSRSPTRAGNSCSSPNTRPT